MKSVSLFVLFGFVGVAFGLKSGFADKQVPAHQSSGGTEVKSEISVDIDSPSIRELSGGSGTVFKTSADAFSRPAANTRQDHRRTFVIGNSIFNDNWVSTPASVKTRQGLGPLFNAQSCSSCHLKDGRGRPPLNDKEAMVGLLVRLSIPGQGPHGEPVPVPGYGDQFNHRSIIGVPSEGEITISHQDITGKYADETPFVLQKPIYQFAKLNYGPMPASVQISPRVAPMMAGLGLLEAIDEKDILSRVDADDADGDGISGRANYVWDIKKGQKSVGRFGWKANQPDVSQQNFSAFLGDLGITSPFKKDQGCEPEQIACRKAKKLPVTEIDAASLKQLEVYSKVLAVPAQRNSDDPAVMQGLKVFRKAQCASCHTETYVTGQDPEFPENSAQRIFPYSDLLLHDMGDELADNRPDFEATGHEWRTPPLWGIGLVPTVNHHTRFLHDGRARNLEEAILWHGGESARSRQNFIELPRSDRNALLRFLESL